jgi:hypothetical protein
MKPLCFVLVGVVVGWTASGVDWTHNAVGQPGHGPLSDGSAETLEVKLDSPPAAGSFQVSAYETSSGHGCYVVDGSPSLKG